ncbi:MAG: putative membrane protein [Saprospiraceae bacterium]|jgi:uncharacterized membrane protein
MTLEDKLKTVSFWLRLGILNHLVAVAVIVLGCAYSGFTCQGESMKGVLSIYAFTLFTPQLALEVILLIALLLVSDSLHEFRKNRLPLSLFVATFSLLILFVYWQ